MKEKERSQEYQTKHDYKQQQVNNQVETEIDRERKKNAKEYKIMIGKCGHNLSFIVFVSPTKTHKPNENCKRVAANQATAAAKKEQHRQHHVYGTAVLIKISI